MQLVTGGRVAFVMTIWEEFSNWHSHCHFLKWTLSSVDRGPVGPRPGSRQNWSPDRVPAARNRGGGGGGKAASGCMFFTNVAVEKRYEFFWKNP